MHTLICSKTYISVVIGDNQNLKTIFAATKDIKAVTKNIDYIFLNAGTMGDCDLSYSDIMLSLLKFEFLKILSDAPSLMIFHKDVTKDGK